MFSAGSLQTLDLLKSIIKVETECSKELPDYLLRQNFDIELSALAPEIFGRQLEGVSKFRGKECYFHKLEKQKTKKCWPRFLFRTCSHTHLFYFCQIIFVTNARSFQWRESYFWKAQAYSAWYLNFKKQEEYFLCYSIKTSLMKAALEQRAFVCSRYLSTCLCPPFTLFQGWDATLKREKCNET